MNNYIEQNGNNNINFIQTDSYHKINDNDNNNNIIIKILIYFLFINLIRFSVRLILLQQV